MTSTRTTPATSPWGADATLAACLVGTVAVVWLTVKLVSVWAWVSLSGDYGDTYHYFLAAEEVARTGGGVAQALREYPTPAGLLLLLPYGLGATDHVAYRDAIVVMTTVADALFALLLGRRLGPVAVLAWVAVTASLGQLPLLRLDLLPAVAAGAGVLLAMQGRRASAAVLVALGTGLKLWPVVLFPLTLARGHGQARTHTHTHTHRPGWLAPTAAFATTGLLLVALSLLTGGWARLVSPLAYQRERGLQIEAVAATVPMLQWGDDPDHRVWFSTFHAFEIAGPTVGSWLAIAQAASVVGAIACLALLAWWWWQGANPAALGWLAIVLVGTFVVTSRALSPQYLLWIAAPAVVLVGLAWLGGRPGVTAAPPLGPALVTFAAVLLLCALTTGIYPIHYAGLTSRTGTTDRALLLLTLRNVGLLAVVAWSAACALVVSRGHSRQPRASAALPR